MLASGLFQPRFFPRLTSYAPQKGLVEMEFLSPFT